MQSNNFLCDFDKVTWYENIPKGSPYEHLIEAIYLKDLEAVRAAAAKVEDINHITNFYEDYGLNFRAKYGDHKFCWEPTTALLLALKINSTEIIQCLVEEFGADVNFYNESMEPIESPLSYLIALYNSKERISYLVGKGADINDIHCGKHRYTAVTLMLYSTLTHYWWHGHLARLDYLRFLKSLGADFNKKSHKYAANATGEQLEIGAWGERLSMAPLEIVEEKAKDYFGDLAGEIYDVLVECGAEIGATKRPERKEIPDHWRKWHGDYPKQKPEQIEASIFNNYGISFDEIV
jgi:hypothetical protein